MNPSWAAQCDAAFTIDVAPVLFTLVVLLGVAVIAAGMMALLTEWVDGLAITGHRPGG